MGRIDRGAALQSHLTGIEIWRSPFQVWWHSRLQSHLTGIEMIRDPYSRTKNICPSIAPHWNWNSGGHQNIGTVQNLQSHLTGIEMTLFWTVKPAKSALQSHLTGIEIGPLLLFEEQDLYLQSHLTGIEIGRNFVKNQFRLAFNRTSLELKFCLMPRSQPGRWTFNRTSLELKYSPAWYQAFKASYLQSHLTGIEISLRPSLHLEYLSLQSHLTGIEMLADYWPLLDCWPLQSHLTGIEIVLKRAAVRFWLAFNRTSLELKWFIGRSSLRAHPSLQSHLTGIEINFSWYVFMNLLPLQSHLTGIEIWKSWWFLHKRAFLQSHLTGIEIHLQGE